MKEYYDWNNDCYEKSIHSDEFIERIVEEKKGEQNERSG